MHWRWNGHELVQKASLIHAFSVLKVHSVNVKGNTLEIQGEQQMLVQTADAKFGLYPSSDEVRLHVDLAGADLTKMATELPDLLFYPDQSGAIADLPARYRGALPARMNEKCCGGAATKPIDNKCDCADASVECSRNGHPAGWAGGTPPRVKYSEEPEFTEEARGKKFNGYAQVGLNVDESGHPRDIWIVRPVGMGLDEKAGIAVNHYLFSPMTCHGKPQAMDLYIDVNFQIF
jgi:hypothetical protein